MPPPGGAARCAWGTHMSAVLPTDDGVVAPPSPWVDFWRSFSSNRGALAGLAVFVFVVLCAVFADLLAPYSPIEQYRDALLTPPVWGGGTGCMVRGCRC